MLVLHSDLTVVLFAEFNVHHFWKKWPLHTTVIDDLTEVISDSKLQNKNKNIDFDRNLRCRCIQA